MSLALNYLIFIIIINHNQPSLILDSITNIHNIIGYTQTPPLSLPYITIQQHLLTAFTVTRSGNKGASDNYM